MLVIDETNFNEYFFDTKTHRPKRGQIMAKYTAVAELIGGQLKNDIIGLLKKENKADAACRVFQKLGCAAERDSIRVCREILEDLLAGRTEAEILEKPYKYIFESFYYTQLEHVPLDDFHWSVISLDNLDEFLDAGGNRIKMTAEIKEQEPKSDD